MRSFEYAGHEIPLKSLQTRETVVLTVAYSRELGGGAGKHVRDVLAKAANPGTIPNRWLQAYLNDAALRYANDGERKPYVSIQVEGDEGERLAQKEGWFLPDDEKLEWCENTLAWRLDGHLVQFVDSEGEVGCSEWIVMSPRSYVEWYRRLNERTGVEALFGND